MEHLAAGLGSSLLLQAGLNPGWQCQAVSSCLGCVWSNLLPGIRVIGVS